MPKNISRTLPEVEAAVGRNAVHNNGKNELRRNDYGFSIGGPIKKDKLFIFYSQEWNIEMSRRITRQSCVPPRLSEMATSPIRVAASRSRLNLVRHGVASPATPYVINPGSIDPAGALLETRLPRAELDHTSGRRR